MSCNIFANGSQFQDWTARNCDHCSRHAELGEHDASGRCDIFDAFMMSEDGSVSDEIGKRAGYDETKYTWRCPEFNMPTKARVAETDALWNAAVRDGLIGPVAQ